MLFLSGRNQDNWTFLVSEEASPPIQERQSQVFTLWTKGGLDPPPKGQPH